MPRSMAGPWILGLLISVAGCTGQASPPASIDGGGEAADAADAPQSWSRTEVETFPQVIVGEVEYYTSSPAQGRPPDGKFADGTKVRIRRNTGSYSLVRSEGGVEGYVRTDQVQDPAAAGP